MQRCGYYTVVDTAISDKNIKTQEKKTYNNKLKA